MARNMGWGWGGEASGEALSLNDMILIVWFVESIQARDSNAKLLSAGVGKRSLRCDCVVNSTYENTHFVGHYLHNLQKWY